MNLLAKPVIPEQYWIITDGKSKIGNVEAQSSGYHVKVNGETAFFCDTGEIESKLRLRFESGFDSTPMKKLDNEVYDIRRKIKLFTRGEDSKCYYACGYYLLNTDGKWEVIHEPKYIMIQRYQWRGPWNTVDEAETKLKELITS